MAPKVKAANANAATVKTTTNNFEALAIATRYFTIVTKHVLRLNKHYFITVHRVHPFITNTNQTARKQI